MPTQKIVYLTFPAAYHAILERFAVMKKKPVEEMLEEAVECFFATLLKLPVCSLEQPEHSAFRDFVAGSEIDPLPSRRK